VAFWQKLFKKRCLGINISGYEIKAMFIKRGKNGFQVVSAAVEPVPQGVIENGSIVKGDRLAITLSQLVEKLGVKERRVVTAISGEHVITRHLKFPLMSKAEVKQALKWETEKYIPLAEEELIIEHVNFGADDSGENLNILLVAVPKKLVYQFYEIFSLAGLELVAIDIEPLALCRLLFNKGEQVPVALVDLGSSSTDLAIVRGKRMDFSRSFKFGMETVVSVVANSLMMDFQSAQRILREKGKVSLDDDDLGKQSHLDLVVLEGVGKLSHEIKRSFDFYRVQSQGIMVEQLFLSGELASMPGLQEYLQHELELKVTILKPDFTWLGEDLPGQDGGTLHPAWAVTAGLALREVAADGTD